MKSILFFLMMFACGVSEAATKFDHWNSVPEDELISTFAELPEAGVTAGLVVMKDTTTVIGITPIGLTVGDTIKKETGIVYVDGQAIKANYEWCSNGGLMVMAQTTQGNNFITNKLWKQNKITIKVGKLEFWVSAKGVQKAWTYLHSVQAI